MSENEHRVKYFPLPDLACGWGIEKIEELYQKKDTLEVQDINDAIEFYNFYLYFHDNNLNWKKWTKEQVAEFKKFSDELKALAFKFVGQLDDASFLYSMKIIFFNYIDDLLTILKLSTNFKNITQSCISVVLQNKKSFIYHAIKNESFTNHFGEVIRSFLIKNNLGEMIISAEDSKNNSSVTRTFIPKCLTEDDRNRILETYINSSEVNINYLTLLISIPFEKKLPIPLLVKAKNRLEECRETIFKTSGRIYSFSIRFANEQIEKAIITNQDYSIDISYSLDWINNRLSYDSILYNFVDLFCFVDGQYRIMTMNGPMGSGFLDSLFMLKNDKIYRKNIVFDFVERLLNYELLAYRNILLEKEIHLEKIVEQFFSDFIVVVYKFPLIKTNLSTNNKSYLEKCIEIANNLDVICKQFFHYTKYKKIDKELIQVDNNPVKIECIPSLVNNKYAQGCGNNYYGIVHILFSNQCMLSYNPSKSMQYENFYDLLQNEIVSKLDYPEYEHRTIEELVKWDIVKIDKEGEISIKNQNRVLILKDLYTNQFINFNRFDKEMKNEILVMEKLGLIEFENTLLSHQESAYINYYLNETYPNGPKLRNKYLHGIQYLEEDENVHFNNYIILLRLLILLTLKINDDLCLYYTNQE